MGHIKISAAVSDKEIRFLPMNVCLSNSLFSLAGEFFSIFLQVFLSEARNQLTASKIKFKTDRERDIEMGMKKFPLCLGNDYDEVNIFFFQNISLIKC